MAKRIIFSMLLMIFSLGPAIVEKGALAEDSSPVTTLSLSLTELTQDALKYSAKLESARLMAESTRSEANSLGAAEFPHLQLGGTYFYDTTIPELSLSPKTPSVPFGFNNNWSANASLNFDLWDFRSLHNQANSAFAAYQAQDQSYEAAKRELLLALRMEYFQVQINLEQVRLLGDSLKVAQAQYEDISHQAKFGTASRLDSLSSHQEVLSYQRSFSQAQANLSSSLRDLFNLAGVQEMADFTDPMDFRMKGNLPKGVSDPSVWLSMDPEDDSLKTLRTGTVAPPDDSVPQAKTYAYLAESVRFAADASASGLLPKLTFSAQAGYQDPIGPINQTFQQNTVSLTASMPLFDWGQILDDSDAKRKQSQAYLKNLDQAKSDLTRDWNKAQDQLRSLNFQQTINQTAVTETDELARLTYSSYRAGSSKFLEVQTANYQALNAKVQAISNEVQMLMQLSVLSSLSGDSSQSTANSQK